jgi:hypothetical protein
MHDFLPILHVILLVPPLPKETECSEETVAIWDYLFDIESLFSEGRSELSHIRGILAIRGAISGRLDGLPHRLSEVILIGFRIVLLGIAFISSHFIII